MSQGKKIPEATWNRFLKAYAEEATSVSAAARFVGIRDRSFYYKCAEDPVFAQKAQAIRDGVRIPFAEDKLFVLVNNGDLGAIKFFLTHVGGRRWNTPKVLPFILKLEADKTQQKEEFKQGLPDHLAMIAGIAYEQALDLDYENIPKTLTIDLTNVQMQMKDPKTRKKIMEENPQIYDDEDN